MSERAQKCSQDVKSAQCFLRISIGGELLAGDIVIELDVQNRPKTCESFMALCADTASSIQSYANDSAKQASCGADSPIRTNRRSPRPTYRGCEFHRVVPGLCVQAGDWERFDGSGGSSPLYGRNWKDEAGTPGGTGVGSSSNCNKHDREGIVSMANAGKPNTNGSQFFVTLKPTPHLDGKHTVFGRVVSGMESVRKMVDVDRGEKDRPVSLQRIVIEDCGHLSLQQRGRVSGSNLEDEDRRRSRSKKHKSKKESKKGKRKRHDRRHRDHLHRRFRDDESSFSESHSDDDDSAKKRGRDGGRESKRHRKKHRRRNTYKSNDSSDGYESSDSSTIEGSCSSERRRRRRRSSRDAINRSDSKKRRKDKKGSRSSSRI